MIKKWANLDNASMYENMPLDIFNAGAVAGGLDNGCDVNAISDYISSSYSILELGVGYGRVLDCILALGYKGKLYGVERNKRLCTFLVNKFNNTANIICSDIKELHLQEKFDLILWMWGSISEFSKIEQLPILRKVCSLLAKNGALIFDTFDIRCRATNAIDIDSHNRIIDTPYGCIHIYMPSIKELNCYAEKLDMQIIHREYTTNTNKTRILNILANKTK